MPSSPQLPRKEPMTPLNVRITMTLAAVACAAVGALLPQTAIIAASGAGLLMGWAHASKPGDKET